MADRSKNTEETDVDSSQQGPRSGRCAIIGVPNVGKSTLLNTLLGQKLAITNRRPQTTRTSLLGVYTSDDPKTQIAFIDTPGMHRPQNALGRNIVESAKAALAECDVVVFLTDVGKSITVNTFLSGETGEVLDTAKRTGRPVILVINKIDRLEKKEMLLPLLQHMHASGHFTAVVPISARRASNIDGLVREIRAQLPEGLLYPDLAEPDVTDKPERFFAAELVREAAMEETRQEVPYSVAVIIDEFNDGTGNAKNVTNIKATIIVGRESHKGIIIGKGGERLKAIGTAARKQMELMFDRKVFLQLWVKVIEDWTENPSSVRELLDANDGT